MSRWAGDGGYKEVLKIAGPLILSMGSWSLMHFIDRIFLTWYSAEALAAAMPAGLLSFAFGSFFIGTAGYVNTFVAQYYGAKRFSEVGASVWQGLYFSLVGGGLMLLLLPCAKWIFDAAGHPEEIRAMEVVYFRILTGGIGATFVMSAVSTFFSGRGDTWTVLWVNLMVVVLNIILDYAWIFGYWGFPRAGIAGAGYATVISQTLGCILFFLLMLRKPFREKYNTLLGWRFNGRLCKRLWKYGAPNGFQFMVEIMGFAIFVLLVGRLGTVDLAATNLAFNINTLAFVPMLGGGVAVSTLVGQYLGDDRPEPAERSTYSALHLSLIYMLIMGMSFWFLPEFFMKPFESGADATAFAPIRDSAIVLLRFVAIYCVLDAAYIVFSAAIKGAGDTQFVMRVTGVASLFVLIIPTFLVVETFELGLYPAWIAVTLYIALMSVIFLFRFKGGKWKTMRVIESDVASLAQGRQVAEVNVRNHIDAM
ncbi:MAG: MATE family multidrug resistance protein [Candidatus Latescibacterota bacterium]|jgi:MATE family multidrug resistance protein